MAKYKLDKNLNASDIAKLVIEDEINALKLLQDNLPADFNNLADELYNCKGKVILSGMGKSGHIAKKIAASLASTGTSSFYLHPGEASHGDLGMIAPQDIVILLSNSGETREILDIINYCKRFEIKLVAMCMNEESTLAEAANYKFIVPKIKEAREIDAPTSSALIMLALGDALTIALHEMRGFTKEDYQTYHPGGKLGANLQKIAKIMHQSSELPLVELDTKMSDILLEITSKHFGCCGVTANGELVGIITDGDLRRNMGDDLLNLTAKDIMSKQPLTIKPSILASEALNIINKHNVTCLFVTDDLKPVGIVHIHDLLRLGVK